jgi:hypothetical protein
MSIKISELPAGSALSGTEEIPIVQSATTKKITAQDVADLASGGDLQQVTDNGNTTTHDLIVTDGSGEIGLIGQTVIVTQDTDNDSFASINNDGSLRLAGNGITSQLKNTNVTNPSVILEFPDKATGSYTIATTNDLTSGYVPYTGATADVDLGTYHLDAAKGTFTHNGSTDTLTANHTSGSGIGLLITKGGNNEGLKVNKTSGSGNAATIIGTLEATTLVKSGGAGTDFLMADGTTTTAITFLTPRVQTVASSATVTAVSTNDIVTITAQAVGLTLANPTGTFSEGQSLIIRIKDNGTARSIAYGTNFRAIGVTAPTITTANKTTYIGCIYNSTDTKFDIVGTCTEA